MSINKEHLYLETNLFDFSWNGTSKINWKDKLKELSSLAETENWGTNNKILDNYIKYTFYYIATEYNKGNKEYIAISKNKDKLNCLTFNTGLFTTSKEPIYAYFVENEHKPEDSGVKFQWFLIGFKTISNYELSVFKPLPSRMYYFKNPSELVFDPRIEIRANVPHILNDDDNVKRLPKIIQCADDRYKSMILQGAIDMAKKSVAACFSLAVPQYYKGSLQLLLPLYLTPYKDNSKKPDLVLTISKSNNDIYVGRTCLTYEMAYMNARLISKPYQSWLAL